MDNKKVRILLIGCIILIGLVSAVLVYQNKSRFSPCGQATASGYSTEINYDLLKSYIPDEFNISNYESMQESKDCFGPGGGYHLFIKFKSDDLVSLLEKYLESGDEDSNGFTGSRVCTPSFLRLPTTNEVKNFWNPKEESFYPVCWHKGDLRIGAVGQEIYIHVERIH